MQISNGVHPLPIDPGSTLQKLVSFTPGRVNLIGEHTDYNGGMVMPAALDLGLRCEMKILNSQQGSVFCSSRSSDQTLELSATETTSIARKILHSGLEKSDPISLPETNQAPWARYVVGCFAMYEASLLARQITKTPWSEKTLSLILESTLPQGAGLSSSAALCISLLGQLNFLSGAPLEASTLARLAMLVEHRFAGTHCGLMDQLAVLCSRSQHYTKIDFLDFPVSKSFHISYAKAHEAFHNHVLLIFKTGVSHSLAESAYNERRASCDAALKGLNSALGLGAHSLGELARLPRFQSIPTESEYLNSIETLLEGTRDHKILAMRATHAMLENTRVVTAAKALSMGDIQTLNDAMRASHRSLDKLYDVSSPELNMACQSMEIVIRELCHTQPSLTHTALVGPRMTGGGFGGSTVQLVHRNLCDAICERFLEKSNPYTESTGIIPQLFVTQPSAGFAAGLETIE